jgi:hypothetical protein
MGEMQQLQQVVMDLVMCLELVQVAVGEVLTQQQQRQQ